ncbi:MAG TPA: hypothetical protein VKH37_10570, partial [Ferruginibacter sp.]|nr:hypothetical protein [Ferruginibacter sp.]
PPPAAVCYCNKPIATQWPGFVGNIEDYLPLKAINNAMHRFKLDSTYKQASLTCSDCYPCTFCFTKEIVVDHQQKLWIDKEGMFLDLTPCMHASNRYLMKLTRTESKTVSQWYNDDHASLMEPTTLTTLFERALAVENYLDLQYILESVTGDKLALYRMLKQHYQIPLSAKRMDRQEEEEALEQARQAYQNRTDRGISFYRHLASVLVNSILPYYPAEARVLRKDSSNVEAINAIYDQTLEKRVRSDLTENMFGTISAEYDSATVALNIPVSMIATCDSLTGKKTTDKGLPVATPFAITFNKAYYRSWPRDAFNIFNEDVVGSCAPAFAIGNTGIWVKPNQFHYALGTAVDEYNQPTGQLFHPVNYPAHFKYVNSKDTNHTQEPKIETDRYLQQFMGVVITEGKIHVLGIDSALTITEMIIDAKEMNGYINTSTTM